jgi:hypothetical protein
MASSVSSPWKVGMVDAGPSSPSRTISSSNCSRWCQVCPGDCGAEADMCRHRTAPANRAHRKGRSCGKRRNTAGRARGLTRSVRCSQMGQLEHRTQSRIRCPFPTLGHRGYCDQPGRSRDGRAEFDPYLRAVDPPPGHFRFSVIGMSDCSSRTR